MNQISSLERKKAGRGFSVIELLIAIVVLTVGSLPMLAMLNNVRKGLANQGVKLSVRLSGQNLLDHIRSFRWDEKTGDPPTYVNSPSAIGLDTGEIGFADFDDVDDFNGYTDKPANGLVRVVGVRYVNAPLNGSVTDAGSPTDFKLIQVTVGYSLGGSKSESFQTLVVNGQQ